MNIINKLAKKRPVRRERLNEHTDNYFEKNLKRKNAQHTFLYY